MQIFVGELETQFDIRISYATQDLQDYKVSAPEFNSLVAAMGFINNRTPYKITQISERYYSLILKQKSNDYLCVLVLDELNQEPLANATVVLLDSDQGFVTDQAGIATIPITQTRQAIRVQYVGYTAQILAIGPYQDDCTQVSMISSVNELGTVFLERIFTKGIYRAKDGSFRFTTQDFGLLPGIVEADVLQITQVLPGVASIDETVSNINIRGGNNSENALLWEGIRMYQSGHFYGLISAFNPYITKNVSIYKNGTASRYGENVSGVIDMSSEDQVASQLEAKATLNLLHANLYTHLPITKRLSFMVAGRRSLNDLYETPVYSSYSERIFQDTQISNNVSANELSNLETQEDFNFYDLTGKLLWDLGEHDRFRVNFLVINNTLDFNQSITNSTFELSETSNLNQRSNAGGLRWSHDWSTTTTTNVSAYRSQYQLNSQNFELFTTLAEEQANEVIEFGLKANVEHSLSKNIKLDAGYQFTETGATNQVVTNIPEFRRLVKEVLVSHAIYGQWNISAFKNNTLINAGIRAVHYPKLNRYRLEPRFSVHQKLGGGFALEVLGELKSQTTSQVLGLENEFLGVENRRWVLANNRERPVSTSEQFSLGVVYNKNNWLVNLIVYKKLVSGITAQNQGFVNQFRSTEAIGQYKIRGVELVLNKTWEHLGAWLSYTNTKNDYSFDSLDPMRFANSLDIRHAFRAALSYDLPKLSIVMGLQWRSGKPFTTPLGEAENVVQDSPEIPFNTPNNERLSSYFRTDFSAKYTFVNREGLVLRLNAAIQNLFNNNNILDSYYFSQEVASGQFAISRVANNSLRITPNLSLEVQF